MIILKEHDFFTNQSIYTSVNDSPSTILHQHEYFEIFYVINGTATHYINNKKSLLTAGTLYIIRPSEHHFFRAINNQTLLHRNFFIKQSEFKNLCNFISPKLFDFIISFPQIITMNLNTQIINCFEQELALFFGTPIIQCIIIKILNLITNNTPNSNYSNAPIWLQELLPFLDKPATFKQNIHEILANTHLSFPYICTSFKKYIGTTLTEYRNNAKLQYAYSLLLTSNLSITQIADTCGFVSRAYFYKEFKKKFNINPSALRK